MPTYIVVLTTIYKYVVEADSEEEAVAYAENQHVPDDMEETVAVVEINIPDDDENDKKI
mgnify:FL=1